MKDKQTIKVKKEFLIAATTEFCKENIDAEYAVLCKKLIEKLARKRTVPFLTGKLENWAAAIVHAIGTINFLQDRSFQPYCTVHDICNYFGTTTSTTQQKSHTLRKLLKLRQWDEEFSTQRMMDSNPFANLVVINGCIIPRGYLENRELVD